MERDNFRQAVICAREFVQQAYPEAIKHINVEHTSAIVGAFFDLYGKELSRFRALEVITADMVGEVEKGWFRGLANLCKMLMLSMANKPAQWYALPIEQEDVGKVMAAHGQNGLASFAQLKRIMDGINSVFPPSQGFARGKGDSDRLDKAA
jgi:hypothetical protein